MTQAQIIREIGDLLASQRECSDLPVRELTQEQIVALVLVAATLASAATGHAGDRDLHLRMAEAAIAAMRNECLAMRN